MVLLLQGVVTLPGTTTTSSSSSRETRRRTTQEACAVSIWLGDLVWGETYVLYTFYLACVDGFSWRVRLRYSDVARIFSAVARASRRTALPPPRKTWRLHETDAEVIAARSRDLATYLSRAVEAAWDDCVELRELLEVGATSFDDSGGPKCKEGYLLVGVSRRWIVLKKAYLAIYERSRDKKAVAVVPVDARFGFELLEKQLVVYSNVSTKRVACALRSPHADGARRLKEWREALETTFLSEQPRFAKPKLSRRENDWERQSFRFESFVPVRRKGRARFLWCGREYFLAVLEALRAAEKEIFLAGWRLNPKILLSRSPDPAISLLAVLEEAISERGVEVYVLLYREFSEALQPKHRSSEVASRLRSIGVRVLRHPNHLAAGQVFWSHHEKLVVVDQELAFVGGLDLVEGRYCDESRVLRNDGRFPGIEFYQPNRFLSRGDYPRLPWQDVAVQVTGPAALDVGLHFIARWNHHRLALRAYDETVLLPRCRCGRVEDGDDEIQVVRSVGRWSLGVDPPERSVLRAWCETIAAAKSLIYVEQQFFITAFDDDEEFPVPEEEAAATTLVVVPPGVSEGESFAAPVDATSSSSQWITVVVPRGCGPGSTLYARRHHQNQKQKGRPPQGNLGFFFDALGISSSSSSSSNHQVVRNEIGRALYDRLRRSILEDDDLRVLLVLPLHPNGKFFESTDVRAVMQQQYATLSRDGSLLDRLSREFSPASIEKRIGTCSLRVWGEMDAGLASEMAYVHSKLLIVDDKIAVVGSANVNDRSMLGDRDSEVAVVVSSESSVRDFRRRLWAQHSGHPSPSFEDMMAIAARNSRALEIAFDGRPWNEIATWDDAKSLIGLSRIRAADDDIKAKLQRDVGASTLCLFPLDFLKAETLNPSALNKLVVGPRLYQ